VSDRYELIAATYAGDQDAPTITNMCAWLEVSTSGFYEWRGRVPSATTQRRERLTPKIVEIFDSFDGTYGYRRVHVELLRAGEDCCAELVRDLMRELGLVACQPRPYKTTTVPTAGQLTIPDLVARDFSADAPGVKLVGSGGRGESHPPAPTEPCMTVARHTATTIQSVGTPSSTPSARTVGGHVR
jgi:putative transposase